VRIELWTPARGADGVADVGEGDPKRQAVGGGDAGGGAGGCEREPEWELEMCGGCSSFTRSLTHSSSSYPNGPAKGGPNSLAGPNSPYPTSRPASLIGRLRNLSYDKVSNMSKLIEDPYRALIRTTNHD